MARELQSGQDSSTFALATAAGACTVTIAPTTVPWRITQIAVEVDGVGAPAGSTCVIRKNGRIVTPLVPDMDAAGGDPPIVARPGDRVTVEWTNLNPGQRGTVTWFYDEIGWTS